MNLRTVRKKIKSVDNVKKITKAMEMVSAVKMKKFQIIAVQSTPYQKFLEKAINNIIKNMEKGISTLLQPQKNAANKTLVVLVSSNKGLCGSFNINLVRFLWKNSDKNVDIVTLGKKGAVLSNTLGFKIVADFSSNDLYENISALFEFIYNQYNQGKYNKIEIIYNTFVSIIEYIPVSETLLPLQYKQNPEEEQKEEVQDFFRNYLIEPSPEEIIHSLLLNYLEGKIRYAVTQTQAGEHSARMIAMQNATNNAFDILLNLTLLRNKLRQEIITNELLDMITAKESVEVNQ